MSNNASAAVHFSRRPRRRTRILEHHLRHAERAAGQQQQQQRRQRGNHATWGPPFIRALYIEYEERRPAGERGGRAGVHVLERVEPAVPRLRQPAAAPALPRQRRGAEAEAAAAAGMGFIAVSEAFMLSTLPFAMIIGAI